MLAGAFRLSSSSRLAFRGVTTTPVAALERSSPSLGGLVGVRHYNFASKPFRDCYGNLPVPDGAKLRADTVAYLNDFNPKLWYDDPVTTILNAQHLTSGQLEKTVDAFACENGNIRLATDQEIDRIITHMKTFKPEKDYREGVRAAEAELLSEFPHQLIGNQALDFLKQDGVTEIEESLQANTVERRLNDQLLQDEIAGKVDICRAPAFVGPVSNFSNFLDLCRKVLRNVELGVPVVVLSRENTTQHMYRWFQMLVRLFQKHGVDTGLLTYASASKEGKQKLFNANPDGALYITSSREVAKLIKSMHPNTVSSTGGPNTLVAPKMTKEIADAVKLSAMIENSGQCTALRHACIPDTTIKDLEDIFSDAPTVSTPQDALSAGAFAGVFEGSHQAPFELLDGYSTHPDNSSIAYRQSSTLPPNDISEQWRQTYVDLTSPKASEFGTDEMVGSLAKWLVRNQPITLAMNIGHDGDMGYARKLFEQTGQVVYTVGFEGSPALTCQARPQEGEVFGEFPIRSQLGAHTKYPVVVPSPTAGYNSHYNIEFLQNKGKDSSADGELGQLLSSVDSSAVRGFCLLLNEYLADAAGAHRGDGSKTGGPNRTILYGLQRPPMNGEDTVLRCSDSTSYDELVPSLVPFFVTNAWSNCRISVDPSNSALVEKLKAVESLQGKVDIEDAAAFAKRRETTSFYNVVAPEELADGTNTKSLEDFPLVGHFVSLYFPLGHIKSTRVDDEKFVEVFSASEKWLKMRV
uniref:Aldehyde dehydrogenase domain-containing protein n=1 Tax=Paramoeba aestuarina TaxID=180227 RepID=A0A7S4JL18_9EUKA|mmetsp:Transcript_11391/g.17229  ORF Transcript_11391/g.17229 Transcript_11391/m.17229 type:complete len:749 (+) Transcript_11391:634-2880(+)